jgi:2-hydroxychromene-2-carboxylate isomerase
VIRFCFDVISPYAYLAWTQIHAVAARHGRSVEPVPVVFGALLGAAGTLGPAEVPAKRRSAVGLDGPAIVAAAATAAVKDRLRRQTDDAIAAGAFGVPTMFDGDQMFWGLDSLPNLEQHLRGEGPVASAASERWSTLPASAQRRTGPPAR